MANLSILYNLFLFHITLKITIVNSFALPHRQTNLQHGNYRMNYAPKEETLEFKFRNTTETTFSICAHNKINDLIRRKCKPVVKPKTQHGEKVYLHQCHPNAQQQHFYPYDARKFIQCYRGKLSVLDCRTKEIFSIRQRICLPETKVLRNDHVPCPSIIGRKLTKDPVVYEDKIYCPLNLFGLFPHLFSNEKYLKCVEGRLYEKSCGKGLAFNFMSKLCVKNTRNLYEILPPYQNYYLVNESFIETQKEDNLSLLKCSKGISGTFIHPFSCFSNINCSPAGTKINTCPNGGLYSFRENKCKTQNRIDEHDHVPCTDVNGHKDEEDSLSLGVFCAPKGFMIYPHPQSQYKYVYCSNGKLQVKRCTRNEIFSLEDLKCIDEPTAMGEENNDD